MSEEGKAISYHMVVWLIISYYIISYYINIILYYIILYHIISYHIISGRIISYYIISYHIISYHIISGRIISYHIISYHFISYHIISYQIRSLSNHKFPFLPPIFSIHHSLSVNFTLNHLRLQLMRDVITGRNPQLVLVAFSLGKTISILLNERHSSTSMALSLFLMKPSLLAYSTLLKMKTSHLFFLSQHYNYGSKFISITSHIFPDVQYGCHCHCCNLMKLITVDQSSSSHQRLSINCCQIQ